MGRFARHLCHYRSPLDDRDLPYLVCAPVEPAADRLPIVFFLHDQLTEPNEAGFVEEGYRLAAQWLADLESGPTCALAFPFGRGNAGWLGWGGADLFTVWDRIVQAFRGDPRRAGLIGVGAGATGALQLASWFPARFPALALIAPWTADAESPGRDAPRDFAWEERQRDAVDPLELAGNLGHATVWIEHPNWCDGLAGTAPFAHSKALRSRLRRAGATVHWIESAKDVIQRPEEKPLALDRRRVLEQLAGATFGPTPIHATLRTSTLRCHETELFRVLRVAPGHRRAKVKCWVTREAIEIKTRGVAALSLPRQPDRLLILDRQRLNVDKCHGEEPSFERLGKRWVRADEAASTAPESPRDAEAPGATPSNEALVPPARTAAVKSPLWPGPVMDLRWGPIVVVVGTLGDELETYSMRRFADSLVQRWCRGADALGCLHAGDRTAAVDLPVIDDSALVDREWARSSLVLIGTPRTNLQLARIRAELPCEWHEPREDRQGRRDGFGFNGRQYADPTDVLWLLQPNRLRAERYLLIVSPVSVARGLCFADRLRTAYLPDFLVHRGRKVLDWGYFSADWQTPVM